MVQQYEERVVQHLNEEYQKKLRRSDRIADKVSFFAGSWRFISIFGVFLAGWVLWNLLTPISLHFDPEPFIFLNLCCRFSPTSRRPSS